MADKKNKKNNRNNKNYDEDYNPRLRKQRKKVCPLCGDANFVLDYKNFDIMIEEQLGHVQNIKEILL